MKWSKIYIFLLSISILFSCSKKQKNDSDASSDISKSNATTQIFQKIDNETSGIHFQNTLKEDVSTISNLFDFDYFYNGAGVGVEDINNDGLLDIFFTGNQVENKLFLNKGNLQFEDISKSAGINVGKVWANGVTYVDINNDGFIDIYVSQGGPNQRLFRKNLLFINNKDNTFTERAEAYGIADMGITTQSAFFDYDNDGDLDLFVMNENEIYGVSPMELYPIIESNEELKWFSSCHLYQNNSGTFKDVSLQAGILRPIFGLGLSISDINEDGLLDIYVASDYYIPDALFINNGNSTFTDAIKDYTNHISYFGMGLDIADVNNDNLQDIFVLDMASADHVRSKTLMASMNTARFDYLVNKADFHHQYMFNSLQINQGDNKFSDAAQLSGMAKTDWSWSVIMSDFDLDSDKDVFITNGYRKYALDNDLQIEVANTKRKFNNQVPLEQKKRLYESMPSEKLPNLLYENIQTLKFKEAAKDWGLGDFSFSNGCAFSDLDNDGDLDLVVNNLDQPAFLYKNLSREKKLGNFVQINCKGRTSENFAKVTIYIKDKSQIIEIKRVRGYMSAHQNTAHFGIGRAKTVDSIIVQWTDGTIWKKNNIKANTSLSVNINDGYKRDNLTNLSKNYFTNANISSIGITYEHNENPFDDFEKEILLPYKQSNLGPFVSKGDVNGDKKDDIFVGGASGQSASIYVQTGNGFRKISQPAFEQDKVYEDMESLFFDFDNDGDNDLFVVSGGNEFEEFSSLYQDRLYINDGKGNFAKAPVNELQTFPKSGKAVRKIDFDKDGDLDLIVGNRVRAQKYPNPAASCLYENKNGTLVNITDNVAKELNSFGIINDIVVTDFNNDGWDDFIAVGEWTGIGFFQNNKGNFSLIKETWFEEKGWWFSINETDVNNDGLKDFVIGNTGLNIKFKASKKKPFKIYSNDFDKNGTNDIVLSQQYKGNYVPVRGRECSSQQMPFIKNKYPSYESFANATILDIYGDDVASSYQNYTTEFNSILLLNKGEGIFEKKILPIEAQFFPIMDAVFEDINNDGYQDMVVAGNIYETEVETTRLDAFSGLVLLSNKKDNYEISSLAKNSVLLNGNIKDLELLKIGPHNYLIATANNGNLEVLKFN